MPDPQPFTPFELVPETPAEETKPALGVGGRIADVVDSVNSGIGKAAHETFGFGAKAVGTLVQGGERITKPLVEALTGVGYQENLSDQALASVQEFNKESAANDGSGYESKTLIGSGAQGISQFVTGFLMAGRTLQSFQTYRNAGVLAQGFTAGAVADATAFDPSQDRLSNLFNDFAEAHPYLRNPLTDYLAADENDSESEGRLKNAVEGFVAGGALEGLLKAFRGFRQVYKAREAHGVEAANKKWAEVADGLSRSSQETKVGFEESQITGGTRSGDDLSKTTETQVMDVGQTSETVAVGKVEAQNRAVRQMDAPLLDDAEIRSIINTIKDNPETLEGGFRTNGAYNYARLETDDGAKMALEEVAKQVTPILDAAHRSHRSFESIRGTAEFFGENPEQLLVDLQAAYKNTKQIEATLVAGRALVTGLSQKAAKLARQVEADPSLYPELEKALQQVANVDKLVRGTRASAARATAAGRIRTAANLTPAEIKALQVASPEQFLKIVREPSGWVKAMNIHNEFWINALLSGPRTHIRNIISNAINTVALPAERMLGGLMQGDVQQIRAGAATFVGLRSALLDSIVLASKASGLTDMVKGGPKNLLKNAKKTGDSILDPKNTKFADAGKAITGENLGTSGRAATTIDIFGEFTRIPGRFLAAEDEFFKQLNYRAKVYSNAMDEGLKLKLNKTDLAKYVEDRVNRAFNGDGSAADEAALQYARRSTFTSAPEPGTFLHDLEVFAGKHPGLRLLMPFIRTPTNILKEAALRTPILAPMSRKFRDAISGRMGKEAQAQAYGQISTGATLWGAGLAFALEGKITGRGPSDPREKQLLLDTGWQPYSFKVGNTYISFEGFDPTSMFFGMAGDFADAYAHMDDAAQKNVIGSMLVAMATNVTSKTYLQGITQVMEALTQPERKMESFLRSRVSSYVPTGLKQLTGLIPGAEDEYMREARSVMDAVINKIPGLSKTLPPRRNIFGEAVTARQALGPDSISPFFYSTQKESPASQELARFSHAFSPPARMIGNIDLTQFKNAKGQDFYDRWQEQIATLKVGRYTLKERLENLVTSDPYKKWRDNEADAVELTKEPRTLKEVQAVIEQYRQEAKRKTLQEFPQVAELVRADRKAQTRASAGSAIPEELQNLINQLNPNR